MKKIDELLTKLKEFKEIKLYKYNFSESGGLKFYTKKKYKAEDGEEIERSVILTNVVGVKYTLREINIVGTALIRGKLILVDEYESYGDVKNGFIDVDTVKEYCFSKLDAIKTEIAKDDEKLYFVDENGILYGFYNRDENKKPIELLISNGLVVEFNGKDTI